jgi:hypothetical protein
VVPLICPAQNSPSNFLGHHGGKALGGGQVVVFHRIGGTQHGAVLQPRQGAQHGQLQLFGQPGGKALHVDFGNIAPLWLQENLVAVFVGKANDFVFNAGAIAGAFGLDPAAVDGRQVQIVANQLVGRCRGAGEVTGHLFPLDPDLGVKAEPAHIVVAGLGFQPIKVDGAAIYPSRGAGFQASVSKPSWLRVSVRPVAANSPARPAGHGFVPHPDDAAQKGAGGENHRFAFKATPK